jgi:uncharacterized protein (TIGR02145 family)
MHVKLQPLRQGRQINNRQLFLLLLILAALFLIALITGSPTTASAQTEQTYWLGRQVGAEYLFDTQLPDAFGVLITAGDPKYAAVKSLPKFSSREIDGKTYNFVTTGLAWDLDLIDNGQIAFHNNGAVQGNWWFNMDKDDAAWKALVPELKALATADGTWKRVTLFVLIAPNDATPTLRLPIPEMTLAKDKMYELGRQTVAGQFYPAVQVPADLDAFREAMLRYGNAGRRDPDFRKNNGSKTATDLTLDMVVTLGPKPEKVFRQSDTPPFFADHLLAQELNDAAQFQAEYQASIDKLGHDGPRAWLDPATGKTVDLFDANDRIVYFGGANAVEAAAVGPLGSAPHGWMAGETHFRPWFNVDGCYPEIGYGAAQSKSGNWYYVAVPVRLNPCVEPTPQPTAEATAGATAEPTAATPEPTAAAPEPTTTPEPTAAAPEPATYANGFPLLAGTTIAQGEKYPSESGNHYLIFQPDNNLVVYDATGQYVWGLESVTDNYAQAKVVQMQQDGNLVVRGDDDAFIWSALSKDPDASAYLNLTPEGALQLISGDTGAILWASDDNLDAVTPTAAATPTAALSAVQTSTSITPTVTDADGNIYSTVQIGRQLWMAENLRTTTCSDGSAIPLVSDQDAWITQADAAHTWGSDVADDAQAQEAYGALYNAYAATDPCNVCPADWRVPSAADFQALLESQGADAHLKLGDPDFWGTESLATNSSGWSARPAGGAGGDAPGSYDFGKYAYFWSATEIDEGTNSLFVIHAADASASGLAGLRYGFSIRCMQDLPPAEAIADAAATNGPSVQGPLVITHTDIVDSVAWSPNGSQLATGARDNLMHVWDSTTGASIFDSTGHTADVVEVAWSPDGAKLATVSDDKSARVWDSATGAELLLLTGHTARLDSVKWSPDGSQLLSASPIDESVRIWDALTASNLRTFVLPSASNGTSVVWSPDGSQIASTTNDKTILVFDAATGDTLLSLTGDTGTPSSVAWSPDGSQLASSSYDKAVRVWDAVTGDPLLTLTEHTGAVDSVAWSPDGSQLASASLDGTVRVWDAATGALLQTLPIDLASVPGGGIVVWSPNGSQLAAPTWDGSVVVWDVASGASLAKLLGHSRMVMQIAWSPDGSRLASASSDETVRVWEISVK